MKNDETGLPPLDNAGQFANQVFQIRRYFEPPAIIDDRKSAFQKRQEIVLQNGTVKLKVGGHTNETLPTNPAGADRRPAEMN